MSDALFATLQQLLGAAHVQTSEQAAHCRTDKQGRYTGHLLAAVHPANPEEAAAVVPACAALTAPIVVQGGNGSEERRLGKSC